MNIEPLKIEGAWVITPRQFPDDRGVFMEGFRADKLAEHIGHQLQVAQTNISISSAGTVRGIHYADLPPSQAKYVTATSGALIDYIVDIRVGSPTFGQWDSVVLNADSRKAVYVSEGLGHAFCALQDDTTAVYLCSAVYSPDREHGVHPLDPAIGLELPDGVTPILSPKDETAPTLAQARRAGALPDFRDCLAYQQALRS